jgi:hypothetical protein
MKRSRSHVVKACRFVEVMLEIKRLDPTAYAELLAEAKRRAHPRKTPEQLARWNRGAS